ncbi:hypothetical protein [Actinoplanes sp. CA-252034]|uniref:hypothetical protein n=1 Tax=Actinoplanes sp. CA-252034 TaxID=3239906 RepID=UPI003D9766AB
MPKSKLLTILATGAWIASTVTFGLHLAGSVPSAVFQLALAGAVCLTILAGLERNGTEQVKTAFTHGMRYGQAHERKESLEQTARIVTVPLQASGRARVPDRDSANVTLRGQRPVA